MSETKTPVQSFIIQVESILKASADLTGVAIYNYWLPPTGAKLPAISIIEVGGARQQEVGIGQQRTATEIAVNIPITLQLDVWARTASVVRGIADKVRFALWSNRSSFGDDVKGVEVSSDVWRFSEPGTKEELYRKMFTVQAVYKMAKAG